MTFTLNAALLQPIVALIAGILILLIPRILNFIVAIYLIFRGRYGVMASPSIGPSALKGRSGRVHVGRRICCDDDDHKIDCFAMHASGPWRCLGAAGWTNEVPICDGFRQQRCGGRVG